MKSLWLETLTLSFCCSACWAFPMFSLFFIILSILGILICFHQYWNAGFHLGTPWMETYVKSQRWPLRGVKIFCNKHQKAMTNTTRRLFTVDKRYICNRITTSGCWARCTKANTSNHCPIVRSCVRGCSSLLAVVVQHVVHASRSASRPRFQGSPRGSFGHLSTLMTLFEIIIWWPDFSGGLQKLECSIGQDNTSLSDYYCSEEGVFSFLFSPSPPEPNFTISLRQSAVWVWLHQHQGSAYKWPSLTCGASCCSCNST